MSGISFTGIGSGIDTKAIVNALVSAEIDPQRQQLSARKSSLDAQLSSFGRLKSALNEFQSTLDNLKSAQQFQVRSASVSDENKLNASASPSAEPGQYEVTVENLAKSQRLITADGAFSSSSDVVGSGTITISTGGAYDPALENGFSVNIDPASATLDDIRQAINNAEGNNSVSASIVNVDDGVGGTQARLILTANQTGTANALTIDVTEGSVPGLSAFQTGIVESRPAEDAVVTVNGLTATRSSNQINDVIQGVTLDLKTEEPGAQVDLTIGTDNAAIEENVQGFVDAYNKLQSVLRDLGGNETSGLQGDSTVRNLSSRVRTLTSSEVAGVSPEASILAQIGVSVDKSGVMKLNATDLKEKLNENFSSVADIFSSPSGVANRLDDFLDSYTNSGGLLETRTEGVNSRLSSIEDQELRIDSREESLFNRLSSQFNAMESIVSQINSNGDFLTAQLAGM